MVKQIETNYLSRKEESEGGGGFAILRFETQEIGTENIIIDQCKVYPNNVFKNCLGEQKFLIEILPNEPLSKEVPPNGIFVFTVIDTEGMQKKVAERKIIIEGNKAKIYSLGKEMWNKDSEKGDLISQTNIINSLKQ